MARKKEETPKETTSHRVLQNLRHDGKHYNPKSTVELAADEAAPLIRAKVVEPILSEEK